MRQLRAPKFISATSAGVTHMISSPMTTPPADIDTATMGLPMQDTSAPQQREETLSQRSAPDNSSDEEEVDDDIDHAHILHNLQGSEALQSLADQTRQAPSGHAGDRARSLFVTQWYVKITSVAI